MANQTKTWDISVVGAGPAGLSASIYTSRYNLDTLVLGPNQGGLITEAHEVCNFPGSPNIEGNKLGEKIASHAEKEGAQLKQEKVLELKKEDNNFELSTNLGENYNSKALLFATGSKRRELNLDREKELRGSGVSYCATCDGRFFEDDVVAVVGGANAAATAALYLADLAKKVYLIYRRDELRCVPTWKKEVKNNDNIEVIYNTNVVSLKGEDKLEAVELDNEYQNSSNLALDGLFIEIGSVPRTKLAQDIGVEVDEKNHIKIDEAGKTNLDRVWAAGDLTTGSNQFKQVITAAAEGAIAANDIYQTLHTN